MTSRVRANGAVRGDGHVARAFVQCRLALLTERFRASIGQTLVRQVLSKIRKDVQWRELSKELDSSALPRTLWHMAGWQAPVVHVVVSVP